MIQKILKQFFLTVLVAVFNFNAQGMTGPCLPTCVSSFGCLPVSADFVIVGLGTAGATAARYLTDPTGLNASVIVLEAGLNQALDPNVTEGGPFTGNAVVGYRHLYTKTYGTSFDETNQNIFSGSQQSFYGEGRMWGGSSANYYFLTVRGSPYFYNTIANLVGNQQWNYDNLLPFMVGMENFIKNGTTPVSDQRGKNGLLPIAQFDALPDDSDFLNAFAFGANCPIIADYNNQNDGGGAIGLSSQQIWSNAVTKPNLRTFSVQGFLPQNVVDYNTGLGLNGRRLRIISAAYASRILFQQTAAGIQAIGVEYILSNTNNANNPNEVFQVYANKAVIMCGGSIQDPALLQRSGIGDPALLNSLGISVVVSNTNVGQNLRNQYGPCAVLPILEEDTFPLTNPPLNTSELGFVSYQGIAGTPPFYPNAFYSTPENAAIRRSEMVLARGPFQFPVPGILNALGFFVPDNVRTTVSIITVILDSGSKGSVQIVSTDPLIDPQINFNLFSDGDQTVNGSDLNKAVAALKVLANVAIRQNAVAGTGNIIYPPRDFYPGTYGPAADDSLLASAAKNAYIVMNHPCGTCAMGASINATGAVVSSADLSVFGIANGSLRIASNSVWPQTMDGNTGYFAYLIGLKMAQILGATTVPQP